MPKHYVTTDGEKIPVCPNAGQTIGTAKRLGRRASCPKCRTWIAVEDGRYADHLSH